MAEDVIKESDLIQSDGTIDKITTSLELLIDSYGEMVTAIKKGSSEMIEAIKSMSTSTKEGRTALDDMARAAQRLERAQKEYEFAQSDIGKEVADLKSKTAALNRTTAESKKTLELQAGSYERIRLHLKHLIDLYKNMSAEQRAARGDDIIQQINKQRMRLAEMDEQLKTHVTQVSKVQKAEEKLAYLVSEEGQRYLELKAKIREVMAAHTARRTQTDALTQAQNRYNQALDATNLQARELDIQTKILNQTAKYQAQINQSAEGSYNRLAAQYALNKIKLNAMSASERSATESGKKLEQETAAIYKEMIRLQEATGNHRLSVGNYAKSWDGLGMSVSQVVRELPAAAVSLNTFFLGISNNIPIVVDEIKKVVEQNKQLRAEGKPTVSVTKQIVSALFSWQTALVVLLYALSANGKEIISWITSIFKGKAAIKSHIDILEDVSKELKTTNDSYGENMATLKKLQNEWKNLSSLKEQKQWIRDNKTEFDKLDVSVRNVNDAENIFVNNTAALIKALEARAEAAAAMKLAADKYEEALTKEHKAEVEAQRKGASVTQNIAGAVLLDPSNIPGSLGAALGGNQSRGEIIKKLQIKNLRNEAEAARKDAEAFIKLANARAEEAEAALKAAGIDTAHKFKKGARRTPRERDLTDIIFRNDLTIQKKYEASITALQRDEFKKRKNEAIDSAEATIRELQEKFRKNEVFLAGKKGNKPLTEEQKQQVEKQQKEIAATIENIQRKLSIDLQDIEDERQIDSMTKLRQTMQFRYDTIAKEIKKEKELKLEQLDLREASYTTKASTADGKEATVTGQATPEQIAAWHKQRAQIEAKYDQIILDLRAKEIQERLYLVKKGTKEERQLLLEQIETARKLALIQNRAKPVEQQESESSINARFGKQKLEVGGNLSLRNFQQQQALSKSVFDLSKHTADEIKKYEIESEIALWKEKIRLAKSGSLDWSQAQIDTARNTVDKLEKELDEINKKLSLLGRIGKYGVTGFLLSYMGFDDAGIQAWNDACNQVISNLQEIAQAEVDVAQAAVEAAEKRVEAAQSAYDAEVEGRNNGYANQVATKKKELQQEKKNQQEKQKLLEQAQKRQEAINTVVQASSLITASANIWEAMSSVPIVGPALALAAIATMWTSFAVAKVKAKQATAAANQAYGEGGLEFLEGGSHASGNDIDLHQKNSRGKNMRAEGGEAMAIINKRNTRKYKRVLPDIVDSLNKGTFEDKFTQAFNKADSLQAQMITVETTTDLSNIERGVEAIKKQNSERIYPLGNGRTLIIKGNVRRYINN